MDDQLPEPLRTVEHELTTLLRRGRTVSWGLVKEVHPHLEPNSYSLLLWLRRSGSTRLTDLSTRLGVGKGTLSRQIRGLEALGLVRREPDPLDRRAAQLSLTEEGQRRFDAARGTRLDELERALDDWPTEDLAEFARLLRRFNESWTPERG
ncbi:MarR family winged helix-turn-helix transcriptional regulator [Micromonospora echinospora]|uniref:MarR family winged helix-turn-helix transcriptional regulator n=1 Tax=Micromonospora echinospora TaxID=1877 RepID=UPI00366AE1AC